MKQNTQNGTHITIKIHKRYLYKITQKHTKHTIIYTKHPQPHFQCSSSVLRCTPKSPMWAFRFFKLSNYTLFAYTIIAIIIIIIIIKFFSKINLLYEYLLPE